MAHETEIKLAVANAGAARRALRAAGFHVSRRRVLEANTIFDTPKLALRRSRTLLRLREAGGVATLTYKGAPLPARHKVREELESELTDPGNMRTILERLGYRVMWCYEKYRTEYRLERGAGMAMLDETPIGVYLELEGSPRWIDRMARALGFAHEDYITASYGRLYLNGCRRRRVKPGDMLF
ncbi:MAG TPA: class IV adenylate cyclase [Candidatus Sulfopaludibacter sp.]|nr:class IV adenylate cyclase [Candidatus Sulfopaludibacter sp.]